jgi:CRISPR-associated endonuclease/helicase Cas3
MAAWWAHSRNAQGQRQELVAHLRAVAALARQFADPFGGGEVAERAGLWHDLGKFHPDWQHYLVQSEAEEEAARQQQRQPRRFRPPDHKGAGVKQALDCQLEALAFVIQGHHGGLPSQGEVRDFCHRVARGPASQQALALARQQLPELAPLSPPALPPWVTESRQTLEFFLRMIFSALVDADSLDTEAHRDPIAAQARGSATDLAALERQLTAAQQQLMASLATPNSPVNRVRREVYQTCLQAAEREPGLFRLTVPTGGGKTRSALAFALRHAVRHGLRRVVVALPYLSITEQTAAEYRAIFDSLDPRIVLEHHSNVEVQEDEEDFAATAVWARLASENWDAPLIVTTTVQLFESLFSNRRAATRKLHRLARSVIILDEAQALPVELLTPILDALRELVRHYGATVVLSTATQPAFEVIPLFRDLPATEIAPAPEPWFQLLRRVEYDWRLEPVEWDDVASWLRESPQALAIVNTKGDALALLQTLSDPTALHLSTLLCGAHRRAVLAEVRRRLEAGDPCRLVATQVVEAGVDLDFPLVVRALGPLDSVIQAAGRCNREGMLPHLGRVIVVQPKAGRLPPGVYRTATELTLSLVREGAGDADAPTTARHYFQQLLQLIPSGTDQPGIQQLRASFDYPQVAQRFRMIPDNTEAVVITSYGSPDEQERVRALLNQLRARQGNPRLLLRALQPYVVNLRTAAANQLREFIVPVIAGVGEWIRPHGYDPICGLVSETIRADELVI